MTVMRFSAFLGLLSLFLTLLAPAASFAAAPAEKPSYTQIRLFSPATATGETETVAVAVEVVMKEGWKIYWRTPGDSGLPPTFDWTGSANVAGHTVKWPAPHRFTIYDIDNIGYKESVVFPIDITPQTTGEALDLHLKMDLLVCSDICVPETRTAQLSLPAGLSEASDDMPLYDAALKTLPVPAEGTVVFEKAWLDYDASNHNYLVIEMSGIEKPQGDADLFVEHDAAIVFGKPEITYDAAKKHASFRAPIHSTEPLDKISDDLGTGAIAFTYVSGDTAIEGTAPLAPRPATAPVEGPAVTAQLAEFNWSILLAALLGGLILNLMPCVLPVLSLKVLSVVSHGGKDNRHVIFKNFMASAAGIIFSFWVIAGALVLLKSAGQTIGWGIQFQHPGFLVFLLVIVLLFAANMWGLFEIPLPRFIAKHASGKPKGDDEPNLLGHFMTGAFATLLATPCTAPFLGTAIGFALARGAFEIFTIFTFLGIGLALPYILLAVSPRVFKYMPKPGKWMVSLRKILALALVATAIWLGSILVSITATPALDAGWEKFDLTRIATEVKTGHTVMVDVTADWCLTCKANKRFVLESREITEALSAENIIRLQADWTQRDEAIADYLQSFGKYGIPFNVVYGPAAPEGIVLPELLTKEAVLNALTEAAGE